MSKKPRKKYYIQPEDLRREIFNFQETGEASERLGEMLIQIATGLAASSKFDRRTYRDDMAGDAVLRMYRNLDLIDTTDPSDLMACCMRDIMPMLWLDTLKGLSLKSFEQPPRIQKVIKSV